MGRARKVIDMQIGNISKQKKMNRKMQEEKIKIDRDALMKGAPSWLSERAAAEYNRVVREAAAIDMLDNLDMSVLAIYADNYDRYLDAAEYLQKSKEQTVFPLRLIFFQEMIKKRFEAIIVKLQISSCENLIYLGKPNE